MPSDEIDCLVGQEIREILILRVLGLGIRLEIEMAARANNRFVKSPFGWMVSISLSDVPLSKDASRITCGLELLGNNVAVQW
jgi:hypothetical protein